MAKKDLSGAAGLEGLFNPRKASTPPPPKAKSKPKTSEPIKQEEPTPPPVVEPEPVEGPQTSPTPPKAERKPKAEKEKSEKPRRSSQRRSKSTFTVDISNVRQTEVKYTGIRLKQDLFKRLEAIKDREQLKSTNSLIATILEAYCNGYEAGE